MKIQIKVLGIIYIVLGAFLAAFLFFVLTLGALNSLGITRGDAEHDISSASVVFFVLAYPTLWILQTGYNIFRGLKPGRLYGLVIGGVLLFVLNVILLLTKNQPSYEKRGLVAIHFLMIAVGLYSIALLAPKRAASYFR